MMDLRLTNGGGKRGRGGKEGGRKRSRMRVKEKEKGWIEPGGPIGCAVVVLETMTRSKVSSWSRGREVEVELLDVCAKSEILGITFWVNQRLIQLSCLLHSLSLPRSWKNDARSLVCRYCIYISPNASIYIPIYWSIELTQGRLESFPSEKTINIDNLWHLTFLPFHSDPVPFFFSLSISTTTMPPQPQL